MTKIPIRPQSALCLLVLCAGTAISGPADPAAPEGPGAPHRLRVELREDPLGVDDPRPRFSWELDDPRRAARSSAYHLLVAASEVGLKGGKGDAWDSGQVESGRTSGVEYAGKPLEAGRTYWWTVRSWDATGVASPWSAPVRFVPAPRPDHAWQASWIRAAPERASSAVGHKSDTVAAADAWPWISLDFGGDVRCDRIRLHPARPHGDASRPGVLFPLRIRVYTDPTGRFADTKAFRIAEYEWQDIPDAGAAPFELELGRYTLRYLRIVATKLQSDGASGYALALGEVEVLDAGTNIAPSAQVTVSGSALGAEWSPLALVDGVLEPGADPATVLEPAQPRLRHSLTLEAPIARAYLHAAALGAYELTVNGRPARGARPVDAGNDAQRAVYQTYDLTRLLAQGESVIGVQLARRSPWPPSAEAAEPEGPGEPAFFAEGEVLLENGRRVPLRTGVSWRGTRSGPLLSLGVRGDETRDARRDAEGWDAQRASSAGWRPVEVVEDLRPVLVADREPPARVQDLLEPASVREVAPGVFDYDFGRDVIGAVRLELVGTAGQVVTIRRSLRALGPGPATPSSEPADRMTLRDGQQTLEPHFGLGTFRYVRAEGCATDAPPPTAVALVVEPELAEAAAFRSSDPVLNAIFERESGALKEQWLTPTDFEARAVVTPFALLRFDCAAALGARLTAARAALDALPRRPGSHDDPAWAEVYVLQPWELWLHTHDLPFLRSSATRALSWIASFPEPAQLAWPVAERQGLSRADEHAGNILAAVYLARSARIAARMALAVDDPAAHAQALAIAQRATSHARAGFAEATRAAGLHQQRLLVAVLAFELWESPEEARAWAGQLAQLLRAGQPLVVGSDLGHRALLVLSRHGHHDLSLELLRRPEPEQLHLRPGEAPPTWWTARPAEPGARLTWARATSPAIGEWLVRAIAGLELSDADAPGPWTRIQLAPRITGGLTSASAEHRSIAGFVRSAWRVEGDVLEYACTVPPGSTAVLDLPAKDGASIELDGKALSEDPSLSPRPGAPGIVRLELPAGSYTFRSKLR
ncbi:MAG: alpha-L-rhamnosidase N-terminal domain-containing protein [Planctomycetes bacterium]|nr:alpha-L-rhamnosidase N-terminal domain-containing protein [Planctomycetota bacterium]